MKILIRIVLIALLVAGLWFAVQGLASKKARDLAAFAAQPRPLSTVAVESVASESWQQYLYAIGSFAAVQDVDVTNEIEGKVTAIDFHSGHRVAEGDVLATLDTSVDAAELEALMADQRLNEIQFERSKRLLAENTISKSEFDIAAARRDEAKAMARAKSASVRKKTIRAPFAGVLGIRQIDLGEYLEAGSKIVSLQRLDPIYLDFATPERFIARVSLGQTIEAEVHAYPGELFTGKVMAIEPGIDRATRNLRIRATFANPAQKLRPGMFAEVRGIVPEVDSVLTVPEMAVTYTPYGNSVFVVEAGDGDLRVSRRQIETGEIRNGRVSILAGLIGDEQIVSAGHNKLRNDMPVRIDGADPLDADMPSSR